MSVRFEVEVSRVTDEAFRRLMASGGFGALYLYYRPGGLAIFGEEEETTGYELGESERIPSHLTREQLWGWIHTRARRLPILPLD